jgi:regulator of sigma E protease
MRILYIFIALLVFGILIMIHELGHYLCARFFKVKIYDFSIGMGPKIFKYTSKKTDIKYSLGLLPIGGYVSMAGEDEESEDENALNKKPPFARFIIVVAGAFMNLVFGFLVMFLLVAIVRSSLYSTTVREIVPKEELGYDISTAESGLMAGDRILEVDGKRVNIASELDYEIMRRGIQTLDVTVERDGKNLTLQIDFPVKESGGQYVGMRDFRIEKDDGNLLNILKHGVCRSLLTVRMVWESIFDLITGRFGIEAVSGPIGVTTQISSAAQRSTIDLAYLMVIISINLGVVNMLPLPALDGGRAVFILLEMIRKKPIPVKYEGMVHFVGIVILMGFMLLISLKDIIALF